MVKSSSYRESKEKEYVRSLAYSFFNGCKNIVSLPNIYFHLEESLAERGQKVFCFERDIKIYNKQIERQKNDQIKIFKGDVNLVSNPKYFDGFFLDYCGRLTPSIQYYLNEIEQGKVVITLLQSRESNPLKKIIDIKNRNQSYINLFRSMGFEIHKVFNYKALRSPMAVYFMTKNN